MKATLATPEVRVMELSKLKPAPYNPRTIDKKAMSGLKRSLSRFDLVEPLVWNRRTRRLVGGHQRLAALKESGVRKASVTVVDLPEKEEKALNVSLNNALIAGEFTGELGPLLEEIRLDFGDENFSELRLDDLAEETSSEVVEDDVPEPPKVAVTKPGNLWILGRHRLLCGDATKAEDVGRVMGEERAILFATDPPYSVAYGGGSHPATRTNRASSKDKNWSGVYREADTSAEGEQFHKAFIAVAIEKAILPDAAWYCWHASRRQAMVERAWESLGAFVHQQIIWAKTRGVLTYSLYQWAHEPCHFGWIKGNKPPKPGIAVMKPYPTSVWAIPGSEDTSPDHPTSKPARLFGLPMQIHTLDGELCYEPFSGSGSQLSAAEQLGRRCFGLELAPEFCDVIVERWQNLTGQKATRE